jgi:hypothetical protein
MRFSASPALNADDLARSHKHAFDELGKVTP